MITATLTTQSTFFYEHAFRHIRLLVPLVSGPSRTVPTARVCIATYMRPVPNGRTILINYKYNKYRRGHGVADNTGDANRPDFKAFARLIKGAKPTTANTLAALLGNE